MSWQDEAVSLRKEGLSIRETARKLGVPYSTLWDFLQEKAPKQRTNFKSKQDIVQINTTRFSEGPTIVFLPDAQVKPWVDTEYLRCQGEFLASKKPDVIVCAGDFADMPSLSSYDKGKKSFEGRRIQKDIEAAIDGMNTLLLPVHHAQQEDPYWKPRMVLTLGNHEQRLQRHVEANPELSGFLGYDNLRYREFGWEVYDYLEPVEIGGVTFIHYWPNAFTGKPLGGSAASILKTVGTSIVQGHKQMLDVATRTLHNGVNQWSIIAGASYDFDEEYKGFTGNKHWRGIVVMHNVKNGGFDPLFVSTDYLKERYASS